MANGNKGKPAINRGPSLVGKKFGTVSVIEEVEMIDGKTRRYKCVCECGKIFVRSGRSLKQKGGAKSCGCLKPNATPNLIGKTFGKLTVLSRAEKTKRGLTRWNCICDCENKNKVLALARNLIIGITTSCGCERRKKNLTGLKFYKLTVLNKLTNDEWNCQCECGDSRVVKYSNLINGNTKFCKKCLKDGYKFRQKERPKRKEREGIRDFEFEWSEQVFKKANYTCLLSGEKGGRLSPHHIYNVKNFPELRFSVDNGVLIQKVLHVLFHKLYGVRFNTPEQFEEFSHNYKAGKFNEILGDFSKSKIWNQFLTFKLINQIRAKYFYAELRRVTMPRFAAHLKILFYHFFSQTCFPFLLKVEKIKFS